MYFRDVLVIRTAHLLAKSELRFFVRSNPVRGFSEVCDGENLGVWSRMEIRLKILPSNNYFKKHLALPKETFEHYY